MKTLSMLEQHHLYCARETLEMSDEAIHVRGRQTKEEAHRIISKLTGGTMRTLTSYERCVSRLLGEDFNVTVGPHDGYTGYFATVFKNDDKECGVRSQSVRLGPWDRAGHGYSMMEALKNAELIAKGQEPKKNYRLEDFEKEKPFEHCLTQYQKELKEIGKEKWVDTKYGKWLRGFIHPDVVKQVHLAKPDKNIRLLCLDLRRAMGMIWELEQEKVELKKKHKMYKDAAFAAMYSQGPKEKETYGPRPEESSAEFYTRIRERVLQKEKEKEKEVILAAAFVKIFESKKEKMVVWIQKEVIHAINDQRAVVKRVNGFNITVKLLGSGVELTVHPKDIVGIEIGGTLIIRFKYNGHSTLETRCRNCN